MYLIHHFAWSKTDIDVAVAVVLVRNEKIQVDDEYTVLCKKRFEEKSMRLKRKLVSTAK